MAQEGSVAPKDRINIVYKPDTESAQEEVELPLKLAILGDFTLRPDNRRLDDREPISVDKDTFNNVLKEQDLHITLDDVPDRLSGKEGDKMTVSLQFNSLADFDPDKVAAQAAEVVPELKKALELRQALASLKSPLANKPEFRKRLQEIVDDKALCERLIKELGVGEAEPRESGA